MARQRPTLGKNHRPRHVGDAAPEFAVDEIGDAAEHQTDRRDGTDDVGHAEEGNLAPARELKFRDDRAEEGAVERHAAGPRF